MKLLRLLLIPLLLVSSVMAEPRVAIQPFGKVKPQDLATVRAGISTLYAVTVELLPEKPLPEAAYYPPRKRYKAEKLLDELESATPPGFTEVVGLTDKDISTTKDDASDWGILGMGHQGGRACMVSTFRLRSGKLSDEVFHDRLVKVVNHELGHTFGLDHCPADGCLMHDAGGKVATFDRGSGKPCLRCARVCHW